MVDVASFGAQLQTKTGGDAIEKLADEEIRLLESIRQHLQKRAKADIDYAAQLYKINQTSPRFEREDASPLAKVNAPREGGGPPFASSHAPKTISISFTS